MRFPMLYSLSLAFTVTFHATNIFAINAVASNYKTIASGKLPLFAWNFFAVFKSRSFAQCAASCSYQHDICRAFVYKLSECRGGQLGLPNEGVCQLVTQMDIIVTLNQSTSSCQRLYVADSCSNSINPCFNGGTCSVNAWPLVCLCPSGYTGNYCETNATATGRFHIAVVTFSLMVA